MLDPDNVLKWEKWGLQDYTQRNMVHPDMLQLPLDERHDIPGVPLHYAPEAPRLKKTWIKKSGNMQEYFKEFTSQMAEMFIHKQLDKLTNDIHRRTIHGVDRESKRLVLHCDFSQDHAHAMADQSMCEFFDVISSSLFIAIAHFWDPETDQLECEGWIFISDNTSHSNNHVNHYLQQIHEHYDAFYVQHDFGHISTLTVWADNCTKQFKSRYQLGWSILYVNKTTLETIHLFFFCPQHGKGPPDGLGGNVKTAVKSEEKFCRHLPRATHSSSKSLNWFIQH